MRSGKTLLFASLVALVLACRDEPAVAPDVATNPVAAIPVARPAPPPERCFADSKPDDFQSLSAPRENLLSTLRGTRLRTESELFRALLDVRWSSDPAAGAVAAARLGILEFERGEYARGLRCFNQALPVLQEIRDEGARPLLQAAAVGASCGLAPQGRDLFDNMSDLTGVTREGAGLTTIDTTVLEPLIELSGRLDAPRAAGAEGLVAQMKTCAEFLALRLSVAAPWRSRALAAEDASDWRKLIEYADLRSRAGLDAARRGEDLGATLRFFGQRSLGSILADRGELEEAVPLLEAAIRYAFGAGEKKGEGARTLREYARALGPSAKATVLERAAQIESWIQETPNRDEHLLHLAGAMDAVGEFARASAYRKRMLEGLLPMQRLPRTRALLEEAESSARVKGALDPKDFLPVISSWEEALHEASGRDSLQTRRDDAISRVYGLAARAWLKSDPGAAFDTVERGRVFGVQQRFQMQLLAPVRAARKPQRTAPPRPPKPVRPTFPIYQPGGPVQTPFGQLNDTFSAPHARELGQRIQAVQYRYLGQCMGGGPYGGSGAMPTPPSPARAKQCAAAMFNTDGSLDNPDIVGKRSRHAATARFLFERMRPHMTVQEVREIEPMLERSERLWEEEESEKQGRLEEEGTQVEDELLEDDSSGELKKRLSERKTDADRDRSGRAPAPLEKQRESVPKPATLAEVQSALGDDEIYVSYQVAKDSTLLFAATRGDLFAREVKVGAEALRAAARAFRAGDAATAAQLSDWLIAPLQALGEGKAVRISRDDVLRVLPLAALPVGTGYLGDLWQISYVDGGYELLKPGFGKRREREPRMLAVAAGRVPGWPRLPGVEREVESISGYFDTEMLAGGNATEGRIAERAAAFNLLHVAVHGEHNWRFPELSRLILLRDQGSDGNLSAGEVRALGLADTDLVVLSACDTAGGEIGSGEEVESLPHAFRDAGARSVVATLWAVDDAVARQLMSAFYRELAGGASKSAALASAQREVRGSFPQIRHWAPFVLVGDPAPVVDVGFHATKRRVEPAPPAIEPQNPSAETVRADPVTRPSPSAKPAERKPAAVGAAGSPAPDRASSLTDAKVKAASMIYSDPCGAMQLLKPHLGDRHAEGMYRLAAERCRR